MMTLSALPTFIPRRKSDWFYDSPKPAFPRPESTRINFVIASGFFAAPQSKKIML